MEHTNETTRTRVEIKVTPLLCREYVDREMAQGWRVKSIGDGRIEWTRPVIGNAPVGRADNLG